jgi:hypothetical protein
VERGGDACIALIGIKLRKERKTTKGSMCHHEEKRCKNRDGGAMNSVTQVTESVRQILEEEANVLAIKSGFIQRERVLSGADASPNAHLWMAR